MKDKVYVSIIIPIRNEEKNIIFLIPQIEKIFTNYPSYELIIINHCSTDNSEKLIANLSKKNSKIKLISVQNQKYKLGLIIQYGIKIAKGEYIITMDGDLSHPTRYLKDFIKKFTFGYNFIIGGRFFKRQSPFYPIKRYLISKLFNFIPKIYLLNDINDFTTGFRGFKKTKYNQIKIFSEGFNFHLEINIKLSKICKKKIEIPIVYEKRIHGKSKLKYKSEFYPYFKALINGILN